jgi:hypothetical protein
VFAVRNLEQQLSQQKVAHQDSQTKFIAKISELETKLLHKNDQTLELKQERDELAVYQINIIIYQVGYC